MAIFLYNENGKKEQVDEGTKHDHALIKLVDKNEWVQAIIGDI